MDSKLESSDSSFEPVAAAVKAFLAQLSQTKCSKVLVAFSGGKDSTALLHQLSKQYDKERLLALYIDHGLQHVSKQWAKQTREFCQNLGVHFESIEVMVDKTKASLEQAARDARYAAFSKILVADQVLVTGHHQDDQAETFLLRLFRGAGTKGLSAMSYSRSFAKSTLFRPLLSVSRQHIEQYITDNKLPFIEDPTNSDSKYRRNFLRNDVIPELEKEWPALKKTIAQSAVLQAENQLLLEQLAQIDLTNLNAGISHRLELALEGLETLNAARQKNVLRYWLASAGEKMLSAKRLDDLMNQILSSQIDKNPELYLEHHCLKRYQNILYLIPLAGLETTSLFDPKQEWWWDADNDLDLGFNKINLSDFLAKDKSYRGKRFKVTLRKGGEKVYWANKSHSQSLKKYLQETNTKPWLRNLTLVVWELSSDTHEYRAIFAQPKKMP